MYIRNATKEKIVELLKREETLIAIGTKISEYLEGKGYTVYGSFNNFGDLELAGYRGVYNEDTITVTVSEEEISFTLCVLRDVKHLEKFIQLLERYEEIKND